jgi:ATP-dependent helicase/nuclease subunit A
MSRSPNPEQLLAIQHQGGVLLRAGAGSGKTFVLVEHILYLTSLWIEEMRSMSTAQAEEFLRSKLSQVVMMTFTKKAAGEMNIRLSEVFHHKAHSSGGDQRYWKMANELLPTLLVTTIDGFCKKLISQGYFPHLSVEAKIIFDAERKEQVRDIIESWFEQRSKMVDSSVLEIVIREKNSLLTSFVHIFSDPGLRLAWKKFDQRDIAPDKMALLLEKSFCLNDLENALLSIGNLDLPSDSDRSAFEKVVAEFQSSGLPVVKNVETLKMYASLFAPLKRLEGEKNTKKKGPSSDAAKNGLSDLRDWVRKWQEVIHDYETQFDSKVLPWMALCQEIFNFVELKLDPNKGLTFGDIEYYVSLGLENKVDRERIQRTFSYFIVDEFQDTSAVQFKIIQGLIDGDFKRLFCVGDAKQAIYGFRGGELSVFQDCAELIPMTRSLVNNYRSLPEVIKFNNSLFRTLLPLGYGFEGHDPFSVTPEDQNVPPEVNNNEKGTIEILTASLKRDLEVQGKFHTDEMNRLEAYAIAEAIEKERSSGSRNVCTILYSKLKPSVELIRNLMKKKIGFTAQFKIDLLDDPILGLFVILLKRKFDQRVELKNSFPLLVIEAYLKAFEKEVQVEEKSLRLFDQDLEYWGLVEAFRKFLFRLQITNENSDINLDLIETISQLYLDDPEQIMNQILRGDNDRLSLELRSGKEAHKVQIMSAHASKGLEFDVVFLGGIYTNGRDLPDTGLFGNLPGSFHWFINLSKREKQKSPFYLYENELSRYKSFSEAKRLFYVACTRAKKKLCWVDFEIPEKTFSIPVNSWIQGLRNWLQMGDSEDVIEVPLSSFRTEDVLTSQSTPDLPLFFHDSVGIFSKGTGKTELMIAAELSVTRLNALLDCPRKFYFQNILKMPEPTLKYDFVEHDQEEVATLLRSSSKRGIFVHEQIAKAIRRNFVVPRESFSGQDRQPVEWALHLLRENHKDFEFIPEKPLKFKFFNFMISGTPDLVLFPKTDKKAQVWDFKTGKITQENLQHYWLQLSVYAYGLYQLGSVPQDRELELILCFVDQKELLEQTVSYNDCVQRLFPIWRKQNEPWEKNLEHCAQCSYGSICPR